MMSKECTLYNPDAIGDNADRLLNCDNSDDETRPLLDQMNTTHPLGKDICDKISSTRQTNGYNSGIDIDYNLDDYDDPYVADGENLNDDDEADLTKRLADLRKISYGLEQNIKLPKPSAPPASVSSYPVIEEPGLDDMENIDDLQEINLDEIESAKTDAQKIKDEMDGRFAQLTSIFNDIVHPENNYGLYYLYDGEETGRLTNKTYGVTFNDYNLLPCAIIGSSKDDINMETQFSRNIKLKQPFVSSPMDTVTEHKMAIKMALMGGIGIIHCNNTPEQQAYEVKKVKRFTNGLVTEPVVFDPVHTIQHVIDTKQKYGYSFNSFPITLKGEMNAILIGLLTKRDFEVANELAKEKNCSLNDIKVHQVMRLKKDLVFINVNNESEINMNEIRDTIIKFRITKLPILCNNKLYAMACRTDVINMSHTPDATINPNTKQLLVGASVSTGIGFEERVTALANAGVDAIVIDSSQGCSKYQLKVLIYIKHLYPNIDVICGNVATKFQTKMLIIAGADAIRVGMGAGSICTTQNVTGTGRSQLSAIVACKEEALNLHKKGHPTGSYNSGHYPHNQITMKIDNIPIIADGGITNSGDIVKALAAGANTVMLGSLLAGTNETPGIIEERPGGVKVKRYRGMGSISAMTHKHTDRYLSGNTKMVAQGVSGEVISKGPLKEQLEHLISAVKSGLQNIGIENVTDIDKLNNEKRIRWEQKSHSSILEGRVHSIYSQY